MSEIKSNRIIPGDLTGDDQFFAAKSMAEELKAWVEKYELCFGHHELFQTIKRLQTKLYKQLEAEAIILNL